jgi:hypothetical protein
MAQVDPGDDAISRFIVRHYRYDPQRHERRHVVVAAFDNEHEMWALMQHIAAEIERRRDEGEDVDPREHASGSQQEPGYRQRAANGHLVSRAIRHGVFPRYLREVELPSSMSVSWAESPPGEDDHRAR